MLSNVELWRDHFAERTRRAERLEREWRFSRLPAHEREAMSPVPAAIVIRLCRASDDDALARLAALESRRLPRGSFVLAELGGEIVAAVPLDAVEPVLADPFRRTAEIVPLLELRARQLLGVGRERSARTRRFRFAA